MTAENLGRLALIVGMMSALLIGCTQPDPGTAAGRSDISGQQCAVCMATNPGDYYACHAICVQRVEDEETYLKSLGR